MITIFGGFHVLSSNFKNMMAHKKLWHAMTNIGAINSRHKNLWCHKKSWITMKICDSLLPNGMPCHHHTED
jgi:hypothetical protein